MDPHGLSPLSVLYLFRVPGFCLFFTKKVWNKLCYGLKTCVPPNSYNEALVLNVTVFGGGALEVN